MQQKKTLALRLLSVLFVCGVLFLSGLSLSPAYGDEDASAGETTAVEASPDTTDTTEQDSTEAVETSSVEETAVSEAEADAESETAAEPVEAEEEAVAAPMMLASAGDDSLDNDKIEEPLPEEVQNFIDRLTTETTFTKVWPKDEGADEVTIYIEWQLDYEVDYQELRHAMKGLGTNEEAVANVASYYWQVRDEDRRAVVDALDTYYQSMLGRTLETDINTEFSDDNLLGNLIRDIFWGDGSLISQYVDRPSTEVYANENGTCWIEVTLKKSEGWTTTVTNVLIPGEEPHERTERGRLIYKFDSSAYLTTVEELLELEGNEFSWSGNAEDGFVFTNTYTAPPRAEVKASTAEPPTVLPATADTTQLFNLAALMSGMFACAFALSLRFARTKSE